MDTELSVMKLTPVLNYIFIILIQNNKTTITREEILKKILNKYDLKVSINTLNQYISTLRKVLHQQLLVENAILSISKKGLVISSEIQIEESITKFNNKIEKSLAPLPLQAINLTNHYYLVIKIILLKKHY
ncbi:transcriptional regulator [Providencia hangzhouensis]|uniref:winged helix-turn-helix domain-containing protein n=1 Tax=Providencia hangzhouensis TaxID=3031799 RepID=UPI0034DDBBA1